MAGAVAAICAARAEGRVQSIILHGLAPKAGSHQDPGKKPAGEEKPMVNKSAVLDKASGAPADVSRTRSQHGGAVHSRGVRIGLFGCSLDTGNRGVSALGVSTIDALTSLAPNADVTLFDFGEGIRQLAVPSGGGDVTVRQVGSFHSRRYYRLSNLSQMRLAARLGLRRVHPMLRRFGDLDVIMDLSGGDSFSDIYGTYRFTGVTLPKLLALDLGIPLILLPQTYGPYQDPKVKATAARVLRSACQVWARDA